MVVLLELALCDLDLLHDLVERLVADELVDDLPVAVQEDDRRKRERPVLPLQVRVVVGVDLDENEVRCDC